MISLNTLEKDFCPLDETWLPWLTLKISHLTVTFQPFFKIFTKAPFFVSTSHTLYTMEKANFVWKRYFSKKKKFEKSLHPGLNRGPLGYEPNALPLDHENKGNFGGKSTSCHYISKNTYKNSEKPSRIYQNQRREISKDQIFKTLKSAREVIFHVGN